MIKKIFIITLIVLILIMNVTVYAGEEKDGIKTEYNWSDFENKPASFFIKFYELISDENKTTLYKDEWELLSLCAIHQSNISDMISGEKYTTEHAYDWKDTWRNIEDRVTIDKDIKYEENKEIGIVQKLSDEVKNQTMGEERSAYFWADLVANIYDRSHKYLNLHEGEKPSFTEFEIDSIKKLQSLNSQGKIILELGPLTEEEGKEIAKKYYSIATKEFSIQTYIGTTYKYMLQILNEGTSGTPGAQGGLTTQPPEEHTLADIIESAKAFLSIGQNVEDTPINNSDLKVVSNNMYRILFILGVIIAVIVGGFLGLKFMTEGLEGKAQIKESLIAYVIGCIILFGAFGIWKMVLIILQS